MTQKAKNRCTASKNRFLNRLYRFIARKIQEIGNRDKNVALQHKIKPIVSLHRREKHIIQKLVSLHQRNSQTWADFIASPVQENFCLVFSIASSVTKILDIKIESLYSIFFSKIVHLYRFKRYIFEYRCPPLRLNHDYSTLRSQI